MTILSPLHCMPAPPPRWFKTAATCTLLASTLLAATAAQAELRLNTAERSVTALDPASTEQVDDNFGPFEFNATVVSTTPNSASSATASQNSDILALQLSGAGAAEVNSFDGNSLFSNSSFRVQFDVVDAPIQFQGSAAVSESGDSQSFANFSLEQFGVANGRIVDFNDKQSGSFSGTLEPGSYALSAQAVTGSFFGVDTVNQSTFNFNVSFSDPVAQPVPEPSAWALALLGLVAVMARCRKVKTPTLQTQSPGL
jgi:hypothetical protein